ncbi:hypothetical protein [Pseudomonas shirazensis]
MKNIEQIRAQFEARYPVPSGLRWDPAVGLTGYYVLECAACCTDVFNTIYAARWEAWLECAKAVRVTNPFPVQMGDPDAAWARGVAEKSLRDQGLMVIG